MVIKGSVKHRRAWKRYKRYQNLGFVVSPFNYGGFPYYYTIVADENFWKRMES